MSQLAVFEGGFTLAAAGRVVVVDPARPLVDVVQDLVDRCLCRRIGEGPRFAVYRSIREFASDRLTVLPHHRGAVSRWIGWCASVADRGAGHPEVIEERANLRAARLVAEVVDPAAAARIAAVTGPLSS